MSSGLFPTIPSSRRSRSCPNLQPLQLHTKETTVILGVSTIPEHGQSTSNVSKHGEITYLTEARYYHFQAIICVGWRRQFPSRAKFSHQSTAILYLDTNHPHFWPSWPTIPKIIKAHCGPFFDLFSLSSFTVKVSSSRELHTEFRPPFVFTCSLSLF